MTTFIANHDRDHREVPSWCPRCMVEAIAHLAKVSDHTFTCDRDGCEQPATRVVFCMLRLCNVFMYRFACNSPACKAHLIQHRLVLMANMITQDTPEIYTQRIA